MQPRLWCAHGPGRAVVLILISVMSCGRPPEETRGARDVELVVIPTLGVDHQFDLDYTVAHVAALLDVLAPNGIIIDDYDLWVDNDCLWSLELPENHVALAWAREHSVPIHGTRLSPSDSAFVRAQRSALAFNEEYPDIESVREGATRRLDETAARIAREYSFAPAPPSLDHLLSTGFHERSMGWTPQQREGIERYAAAVSDSIVIRVTRSPEVTRWVILLNWPGAGPVAERLDGVVGRVRPVEPLLPDLDSVLVRRLDVTYVSWILAGQLDDWYGMWAPQAFNGARIADYLRRLHRMAPGAAVTEFFEARWLMRNRDFEGAQIVLEALVESAGTEAFSFPIVGKWLRPPWSSIQKKAWLNLAFLYDLRGRRPDAIAIYQRLLDDSVALNREARASGYTYDDIESVVRSYLNVPYTGAPEEALRHFPLAADRPACAPQAGR